MILKITYKVLKKRLIRLYILNVHQEPNKNIRFVLRGKFSASSTMKVQFKSLTGMMNMTFLGMVSDLIGPKRHSKRERKLRCQTSSWNLLNLKVVSLRVC
jgi:hypothetical protein